jgi:hypothetical protein
MKSLTVSLPEFRRCLQLAIEDDKKWPHLRHAEWLVSNCDWSADKVVLNLDRGLKAESCGNINGLFFCLWRYKYVT